MRRLLVTAVALAAVLVPASAGAVTIQEFPLGAGTIPTFLKSGPDGNLWIVDVGAGGAIRRVSTSGAVLTPLPATRPRDIAVGRSGNVYWSESGIGNGGDGAAVRVTPDGLRTTQPLSQLLAEAIVVGPNERVSVAGRLQGPPYANTAGVCLVTFLPGANGCGTNTLLATQMTSLVYARDGRMWGVAQFTSQLQQFLADPPDTSPQPGTLVTLPGNTPAPARAVLGPDGNLWVTLPNANAIERINTAPFERTRFALPGVDKTPGEIVVGPDGALWFTEADGHAIGRITTSGEITEFPLPTPNARPGGIAVGSDGNLWFTEGESGAVGRLAFDRPGTPALVGSGGTTLTDAAKPRFSTALKRTKTGFTYTLSEPGKVTITIERKRSGRRVGGRCVRPTAKNRRRAACDRYVAVGTLRANGLQGANTVRFSGRLNGRKLAPGSYRASAIATDAAKNVSAASRVTFTIRKPSRSRR
jgi:streptogramin lyase